MPSRVSRFFNSLLVPAVLVTGVGVVVISTGVVPLPGLQHAAETHAAPAPAPEPVVVTVAAARTTTLERWIEVVGTLEGADEIEVGALVGGRVARIYHDVGDVVEPGAVLLEIDPTEYQLAVNEARRGLELELARLGLTSVPPETFDLAELPSVMKATLQEENQRKNFERMLALSKQKVTTQDDLDRVETAFHVAEAERREQLLQGGMTLASVRQKQAMLATAEKRLADTIVRAPQSTAMTLNQGNRVVSVAMRNVAEGEIVAATPATSLFRLVIEHPLKLKTAVAERFVGDVQLGQRVELQVEAFPREKFEGTIARISPTVDRTSRSLNIEIEVPNRDRRLKAGSFTMARLLVGQSDNALVVPEEAVLRFAGVVKVFRIEQDVAMAVPVETGARLELPLSQDGSTAAANGANTIPWLVVRGDLHPGDQVVITGHSKLADGTPIRIRTETTTEATTTTEAAGNTGAVAQSPSDSVATEIHRSTETSPADKTPADCAASPTTDHE